MLRLHLDPILLLLYVQTSLQYGFNDVIPEKRVIYEIPQ